MIQLGKLLFCWQCFLLLLDVALPLSISQGSSNTPIQKRKVAVAGAGGTLGGLVFGFLQRSSSLFGTGLTSPRCISATADTAVQLNRILSKQFCLAFADESYIKLTDLRDPTAIQKRLDTYDALILGTQMSVQQRVVVPGTYERTPNDKAWEIYWDEGSSFTNDDDTDGSIRKEIFDCFLQAVKDSSLQHLVVVDRDGSTVPKLQETGVPFTCIVCPCDLVNAPDYTFQKGVQTNLSVRPLTDSDSDQTVPATPVCRQDLAALCVQVLQTLSWDTSRVLLVSTSDARPANPIASKTKRIDQEWCVNSYMLEETLQEFLN